MILALSAVLVACAQAEPTKIEIRWTSDEYTFNITLADFIDESKDDFNKYTKDGSTYYKDVSSVGEIFSQWDEIRPLGVDGTYTLKIEKSASASYWTVTTDQTIYAQYNKADLEKADSWTDLQTLQATSDDETSLTPTDNTVILKSTTNTEVVFKDTTDQTPISSWTEVNGFYIGKAHQQVTKYKVETTYDTDAKRPTASISIDGAEAIEYKFARGAKFIDSNQLLLYLRSLDKNYSGGFPSSTYVTVFNPYTQLAQMATFGLTYDAKMVLTDSQRLTTTNGVEHAEEVYTSLNVVSVMIGNTTFMQQENLPHALKDVDSLPGTDKAKYTTVRFRVGYLAYELNTYSESVWNMLLPDTTTGEE